MKKRKVKSFSLASPDYLPNAYSIHLISKGRYQQVQTKITLENNCVDLQPIIAVKCVTLSDACKLRRFLV